ncbi:uncharacterized protein LOC117291849 [Asterias rubens]|uniref:uncharacterized protein LOC117291849 n=1 Tax=Asterias rubens TaxID=7604 RepID=UPI001455A36C|nr:uncharacterized protein LOC117291849 [Asterias rubens]
MLASLVTLLVQNTMSPTLLLLQVVAVFSLTAALVGARYTSSDYFEEILEHNKQTRPVNDPDPVQLFLDSLTLPAKLRPLPPDVPTLYDILEMPSMEGANKQRISFSSTKPFHMPAMRMSQPSREKRSFDLPFDKKSTDSSSEETLRACPANSEWVQMESATTLENQEVIVGARQWFWETKCLEEDGICFGFQNTSDMTSSCKPVYSWVIAWARPLDIVKYEWRFIALKTCCSCAVSVSPAIFPH